MLQLFVCSVCKMAPEPRQVVNSAAYPLCRTCYNKQEAEKLSDKSVYFEAPDKVVDKLWLGSCHSDVDKGYLKGLGISAVVLVCCDSTPRFPEVFDYFSIDVADTLTADLLSHFDKAATFIMKHIELGHGVLVRCAAGASRSPSVVVAYLLKTRKWPLEVCMSTVTKARPLVCINEHFIEQLRVFEKIVGLSTK